MGLYENLGARQLSCLITSKKVLQVCMGQIRDLDFTLEFIPP